MGARMAQSTAVRATARFKQLSCFGLPGEAVIPELSAHFQAADIRQANIEHDGVEVNLPRQPDGLPAGGRRPASACLRRGL